LVSRCLPLVRAIAGSLKRRIGARVDLDDLVGYGSKGLMEAAERFDPQQGVAFSTYASYRIRGAMFDGLRTMGWCSRAEYAHYRAEERANEYLCHQADREATARAATGPKFAVTQVPPTTPTGAQVHASPLAGRTEGTLADIAEIMGGIATVHIISLEAAAAVADERSAGADERLDLGRLSHHTRAAVANLPDRERQLIDLYYFAERTLEDAGAAMGVSKSWACRLNARAIGLLRDALADAMEDEGAPTRRNVVLAST